MPVALHLYFALDYDDCLRYRDSNPLSDFYFPKTAIADQSRETVQHNRQLIDWIINKIQEELREMPEGKTIKVSIGVGSNRQSLPYDILTQYNKGNGAGLPAIKAMFDAIEEEYRKLHPHSTVEFEFDSYLLADTHGQLEDQDRKKKDGENFEKALELFKVHDAIEYVGMYCRHFVDCHTVRHDDAMLKEKLEALKEQVKFSKDTMDVSLKVTTGDLLDELKKGEEIQEEACQLKDMFLDSIEQKLCALICLCLKHAELIIKNSPLLKEEAREKQLENLSKVLTFFNGSSKDTEHLNSLLEIFDTLLDIARDKSNIENDIFNYIFDDCFPDQSKFIFIWMQMQKIVYKHPDIATKYVLIDDNTSILKALWRFIKKHQNIIPKGSTFSVMNYKKNSIAKVKNTYEEAITGESSIYSEPEKVLSKLQEEFKNWKTDQINLIDLFKSKKDLFKALFETETLSSENDGLNKKPANIFSGGSTSFFDISTLNEEKSVTTPPQSILVKRKI